MLLTQGGGKKQIINLLGVNTKLTAFVMALLVHENVTLFSTFETQTAVHSLFSKKQIKSNSASTNIYG